MKKVVFICMFFVAITTTHAQYSNATLSGPWLMYQNPLSPYNDSLMYIIFDGNGSITDFGGFGTFSGSYSVNANGVFSGILNMDEGSFPLAGQLNSQNEATMGERILSRVSNTGALSGTITGALNSECGSASVSLTVDNHGNIIGATGLTAPVSGKIFTDLGVYLGHIKTGVPISGNSHWNEFSMMGYYADNKLNGKIRLDASPNDCKSSVTQLIHSGVTSSITVNSKSSEITVFPNPANEFVKINFSGKSNKGTEISMFNHSGSLVKSQMLVQNQQQVSIRDLSNGVYLMEIKSEGWSKKQKLIILR